MVGLLIATLRYCRPYSDVTGLDMVQGAICFPDIPLPHLLDSTSGVQLPFQCRFDEKI